VACIEQILTDKDFNVMSVFTEMFPPEDCLIRSFQTAIYYDWVTLEGQESPILLPVKERIAAKGSRQKESWYASMSWTDYEKFRVGHTINGAEGDSTR